VETISQNQGEREQKKLTANQVNEFGRSTQIFDAF
jgi:hypothetical protein